MEHVLITIITLAAYFLPSLIAAQPATLVPLAKQGEYKPCRSMIRNLERTEKLYPHSLATLRGIGNRANLGGHYDASR